MKNIKFINIFRSKKIQIIIISVVLIVNFDFTKARAYVDVTRYMGADRYETAAKICEDGWNESSNYAVLVNGEDVPDAVSAAPLAKKYNAPILLTDENVLSPYTSVEFSRLNVQNVFIIGGKGVVPQSIEDAIKSRGIKVTRIAGSNRYETSIEVAKKVGNATQIAIVNGDDWHASISISPIAALKTMPIVLVEKDNIPASTVKFLNGNKNAKAIYILGGQEQISDNILKVVPNAKRIGDGGIFSTNIDIIQAFESELNTSTVYISSDKDFPDSLVVSAVASLTASPIVFVDDYVPNITYNFLRSEIISNMKILGGNGVISYDLEKTLKTIPPSVPYTNKYMNNFTDIIWQNDKYTPRSIILVTSNTGVVKALPVTWNLSKMNIWNPGTYILCGKMDGTGEQVTATLIVKPIPITVPNITKTISSGTQYYLPSTVSATMSDGVTRNVNVTWEYGKVDVTTAGVYTFYGDVEKYSKKVKLILTVT